MPIPMTCPHCRAIGTLPNSHLGRRVRCKHCGKGFRVAVMAEPDSGPEDATVFDPASMRRRRRSGVVLPILAGLFIGVTVCAWLFDFSEEIGAGRKRLGRAIAELIAEGAAEPKGEARAIGEPEPIAKPGLPELDEEQAQEAALAYFHRLAHDPESVSVVEWSGLVPMSGVYRWGIDPPIPYTAVLAGSIRSRNNLGALEVDHYLFYLDKGEVEAHRSHSANPMEFTMEVHQLREFRGEVIEDPIANQLREIGKRGLRRQSGN